MRANIISFNLAKKVLLLFFLLSQLVSYYQISFGFAVQTLIAHFIEPARRDFYTMLIHHIVLVGLVGFSYVNGWIQYGMIVFIVHDVSDISIYLIKIAYPKLLFIGSWKFV